ncbi:hypothetical protein BGZ97_010082 [Linnemannia gamsii]|uniref:Uncharacterized protein n=1 Tax=Linnemannia gamsii TaxID=64522 RepID=A0A9P6QQH6_9FUNG|nr:hypothetical protein BGZ97_010082 [Linnemannia gamsii]
MDGSPTSTFGLQLPTILTSVENYLESFLRVLGGGEPLATVIKAGTNYSALAPKAAAAAVTIATSATSTAIDAATFASSGGGIDSAADAVAEVLLAAAAP